MTGAAPAKGARAALTSPYLLLLLAMLFWSGNSVIARGLIDLVPPMHLSFWRWSVALLILLPFGWRPFWAERAVYARHWRLVGGLALLSVALFNSLLYLALQTTTVIHVSLVTTAIPAVTVLSAWIALGETVRRRATFGMAAAFFGVVVIIFKGDLAAVIALDLNPGDLITLAAVLCWSVYMVFLRRLPVKLDPVGFLFAITALGTVLLVPLFAAEVLSGRTMAVSTGSLAGILYLAVFASVLAFVFFNYGVAKLGANRATQFNYLMPIFSVALAMIFLDEQFQVFHAVGIALILAGVWMAARKRAL